jgi:diguanylate cyclase (GGDEF)-like protein
VQSVLALVIVAITAFLTSHAVVGRLPDHTDPDIAAATQNAIVIGFGVVGLLTAALVTLSGIRARRQDRHSEHLAQYDVLTGLPNRHTFSERVARYPREDGRTIGVALIDINRFAAVNESLGHDSGDQMLVDMGRRLEANLGPHDLVAHLGGDVFGVLLTSCTDPNDVGVRLNALRKTIEEPLVLAGLPLQVEVLMGYDASAAPGVSGEQLLRHAQAALSSAKAGRGALVRYEPSKGQYDAEQLALVGELRRAISVGELRLYYQPKIAVGSGEFEGLEALLRWEHPRHGLLQPAEFLPLAEYTSLMSMLTDWVLDAALAQLIDWGDELGEITMSVNVSARNLTEPNFVQRVGSALRRYRVPASRLMLEVTETAMFVDPQHVRSTLGDLDHAGIRISLDDFGQGQTSLRFLSGLPLSEVKIDREFVCDMVTLPSHAAIVRSVVDLAHRLDLTVVAEGVEDAAALTALEAMGCDSAQGFLLAYPMPPDQVREWAAAQAANATSQSLWKPDPASPRKPPRPRKPGAQRTETVG